MKVNATILRDSMDKPIEFGNVEVFNTNREKLKGKERKEGVLCHPVIAGFCGTDLELMLMGKRCELSSKFPKGSGRLINGHEGVVYIPSEERFAVVLIRGGNSYDPTRYSDNETYFEYGCDGADGIMAEAGYYHPEMLLEIPVLKSGSEKIDMNLAKRLTFADPYACMLFQLERMEDLGSAHNFRIEMAKNSSEESEAREAAKENIFKRVVIFGMGTTGMLLGDVIRRKYKKSQVLFVGKESITGVKKEFVEEIGAEYMSNTYETLSETSESIKTLLGGKATAFAGCSGTEIESKLALENDLLSNNGIYNSFSLGPKISLDTMPFGFKNHLIFGSINFRESHMKEAIDLLCDSKMEKFVELVSLEELAEDPERVYIERIYSEKSAVKSAVVWNPQYINRR